MLMRVKHIKFDQARRLQILAEKILTVPPENFDMGTFGRSCGTIGCAAFWAGQTPELVAEGFSCNKEYRHHYLYSPKFCGKYEYEALLLFFGVYLEFNPFSHLRIGRRNTDVSQALLKAADRLEAEAIHELAN
jgi:hypothetical protein